MAKGRSMKDLKELPQLFGQQQPEAPFAQQLAAHEALPPPAEDIRDAILNLMDNYRGWTVGDVQRTLRKHPDAEQIPMIMNKFANDGKFEISKFTGQANVYTLKRTPVETITSARNAAAKPWQHRDPVGTRQAPDPKGVIKLEEGLDIAIWKIMSDGKYRTKNEICMVLAEYKFDRVQANRRVDSMINSRNYFDRREAGSKGMAYAQKKHLPMPALPNAPAMGAAFANTKENLSDTIADKLSSPAFSGHLSHGHGAGGAADDASLKAIDAVIAAERAAQAAAEHSTPVAADPVVELPKVDLNITKDDTNSQAIWKAMHDHRWYTTPEVVLLVQAGNPEVNEKSIATQLTTLWQKEILERKPVEGVKYFNYRLLEGKPMPANNSLSQRFTKVEKEAIQATAKPTPQQSELPGVEGAAQTPEAQRADALVAEIIARNTAAKSNIPETNKESNAMAATSTLVQVKNTPAQTNVPLVEFAIPIKGEKFTFDECRQLIKELTALGYGKNNTLGSLTLVKQDVTIKGIDFTPVELSELLAKFDEAGFKLIQK